MQVGDAADLPFDSGTFDAVVMRNAVWCLHNPEGAYREACRVLRKGGVLLVTDGQWKKELSGISAEDMPMYVRRDLGFGGTSITEDIMSRLPLTEEMRPQWDLEVLARLGMLASAKSFKDPILPPSADRISSKGFAIRACKG